MQLFQNVWHSLIGNVRTSGLLVSNTGKYEFKAKRYLKSSASVFKEIKNTLKVLQKHVVLRMPIPLSSQLCLNGSLVSD